MKNTDQSLNLFGGLLALLFFSPHIFFIVLSVIGVGYVMWITFPAVLVLISVYLVRSLYKKLRS
jgi:hypothetical protein